MTLLDLLPWRGRKQASEIPLFPLNAVLFPGGILHLKIYETRFLDMANRCLREKSGFGICLAEQAENGDTVARPHPVGTLAEIIAAETDEAGVLQLTVRGAERFRIRNTRQAGDALLLGTVDWLPVPPKIPPPADRGRLLPLLIRIVSDLGPEKMPEPHAFDDSDWVSYRLTEVMPVQNLAKQKLLELDNPLSRLEILEKYLDQRNLLG